MSRIFLISFNTCDYPHEVYPLGLAVVAAALERAGHDIHIYDYLVAGHNDNDLIAAVEKYQPEFICASIRNLDDDVDSSRQTDNREKFTRFGHLLQKARSLVSAPVIIGGAAFSLMPEVLLDLTDADYGIVGEGEKAICRLIVELQNNEKPDRIIYTFESLIPGPEIKGGYYHDSLVRYYYERSGFINIQTKRGCSFRCAYCTYPGLEGCSFRYRDTKEVIDEISRLKKDLGCNRFFFTDSIFNDPAGHYREVAEGIIAEKLDIQWTAYFTPYCMEKADILLCKMAGLYAVELGTDAACSTTLAGLNKMFDWEDVVRANDIVTHADLACAHFVVFGGPDETYQTVEEGIQNCRQLQKCVVIGNTGIRIYYGTSIYGRAQSEGIVDKDTSLLESVYYFSPEVQKDRVDEMITRGWQRQSHLVFPAEKGKMISQAMKKMYNFKGLLWDKIPLSA
ncbi:MAG: B12-binding domain-containing radical SAM protein [Planctomycetes bacterium B3_Pla]|nr:MAG: B12-binding domain-containing radical SAM protein [Planctomycetes bacterium B3_Pla]